MIVLPPKISDSDAFTRKSTKMSSNPKLKPNKSTKPLELQTKQLESKLSKFRQTFPRRQGFKDLQGDVDEIMKNFKPVVPKPAVRTVSRVKIDFVVECSKRFNKS
jgi:TolA-binding protein